MCYFSSLRRLNPSRLTFGPSLRLTGPSSWGLVSDHQPQRWPHCVVISRQIPAPVGEDQGAHHPGGGTGDGEVGGRGRHGRFHNTHSCSVFIKWACFYLDRREKQSLRRAWPKETLLWWVFTFQLPVFISIFLISPDTNCGDDDDDDDDDLFIIIIIMICSEKQPHVGVMCYNLFSPKR